MASDGMVRRRKLRELEAKRDKLMEGAIKNKSELAKIRAELKAFKRSR